VPDLTLPSPQPVAPAAAARVRRWLFDVALPLWAERGIDPNGLFTERMDFAGRPDVAAPRRMRVQARQLYVFNEAALMGWQPAAAVADRGMDSFVARCWAADGEPGWVHQVTPDGTLHNPLRDLYDHAFGLFALAAVHRRNADPRARRQADQALAFLDAAFAHPAGGFEDALPAGGLPRRANPHMHLLEAMLAWYEATGDGLFLERANALIELFQTRFFDPATGTLREYFTADWAIAPGPEGLVVEPGHHCEWAWLLLWAARMGARDATAEAAALYRFVLQHGLDEAGFAVDECSPDGRQTGRGRRSWPQTELLKAHVAMARHGDGAALAKTAPVAERLLDVYLATDVPGLWMDHFDEQGRGLNTMVPASTLYHLVLAFREFLTACG
jgi:mannose-6-phosphate isomerase